MSLSYVSLLHRPQLCRLPFVRDSALESLAGLAVTATLALGVRIALFNFFVRHERVRSPLFERFGRASPEEHAAKQVRRAKWRGSDISVSSTMCNHNTHTQCTDAQ